MLLIVGRNYQRNVFLRRIKNRRTGNLYNSQFRQANQQTPGVHTMPQHGTNTQEQSVHYLLERVGVLEEGVRDGGPLQPAAEIQNIAAVNTASRSLGGTKRMRREHGS
jgi:hypothetical protein